MLSPDQMLYAFLVAVKCTDAIAPRRRVHLNKTTETSEMIILRILIEILYGTCNDGVLYRPASSVLQYPQGWYGRRGEIASVWGNRIGFFFTENHDLVTKHPSLNVSIQLRSLCATVESNIVILLLRSIWVGIQNIRYWFRIRWNLGKLFSLCEHILPSVNMRVLLRLQCSREVPSDAFQPRGPIQNSRGWQLSSPL